MSSVRDTDDMEIVKGGDCAWWNAFIHQGRGEPVVAEQGSQQVGRHPAVAHYDDRAACARQAGEKFPQAFSWGSRTASPSCA
jgi:hypothetical protein